MSWPRVLLGIWLVLTIGWLGLAGYDLYMRWPEYYVFYKRPDGLLIGAMVRKDLTESLGFALIPPIVLLLIGWLVILRSRQKLSKSLSHTPEQIQESSTMPPLVGSAVYRTSPGSSSSNTPGWKWSRCSSKGEAKPSQPCLAGTFKPPLRTLQSFCHTCAQGSFGPLQ